MFSPLSSLRPRTLFKKRQPKVGATPGTLVISKKSPEPQIHAITYNGDTIREVDVVDVERLSEVFDEGHVTWVDVQGFGDRRKLEAIGDYFELHPLLLEDMVNVPQRPRVEMYDDQLLIIVRMVRADEAGELVSEQFGLVVTDSYLLTFQEYHGDILDPVRRRLRTNKGVIRKQSAAYLAYAIADTIIDGYFPVLELVGRQLDELDDEVLERPTPELVGKLHEMKNRLVNLRRWLWAQREAVDTLIRGDIPLINDELRVYLRDTYSHCVQTSEVAEMYRELAAGLMNTYLSVVANRTNEVMKVLTVMASIFIPLTFIAGIYGMNFDNMPELHVRWAYPAVWVAMLGTAGGMLVYFWRKGWLGRH